jgi:hypothetical protein
MGRKATNQRCYWLFFKRRGELFIIRLPDRWTSLLETGRTAIAVISGNKQVQFSNTPEAA